MQRSTTQKRAFYGWYVLAASFFVLFISTGVSNGLGFFVLPMSEEFGWSRATISVAFAIGWLANGTAQPLIGRVYDKYGARLVISVSLLIVGACSMLLSGTNSLWFLILVYGLVMSVAAGGASLVTIHALMARWFYRRRGIAMSIATSGASAGALVIAPFTAYLILWAGWRMTWGVLGAMVLLLGVPMALLLIRDDPRDVGEAPDGDAQEPTPTGPTAAESRPRGPLEVDHWRDSYRSPPMWQLSGAYFVCGMTTAIISFHYVPFVLDQGFSLGTAGLAFGLMSGLNVVGVLGVGVVSDKISRKYLLGSVYAVRGLAYAVLILAPGALGLWGFAVIAGVSWIASAPLTSSLTADIYGLRTLGTLGGLTTFAHQMGGALSIVMGGVLYDVFGSYDVPFAISGSLLAGASIAAFSVAEKRYSARYQPRPVGAAAGSGD
ncbi:MAG: MFS transporter [Chloroflexi bacterium]|nr:MFS transporter [Chloroflexota bacterium]